MLLDVLIALHIDFSRLLPGLFIFCNVDFSLTRLFSFTIIQSIKVYSSELREHVSIITGGWGAHTKLLRGAIEHELRTIQRLFAFRKLTKRGGYLRAVVMARCDLVNTLLKHTDAHRIIVLIAALVVVWGKHLVFVLCGYRFSHLCSVVTHVLLAGLVASLSFNVQRISQVLRVTLYDPRNRIKVSTGMMSGSRWNLSNIIE